MRLKFDEEKLGGQKLRQPDGIEVSIQRYLIYSPFSLSVSSDFTESKIKKDIHRIGGFSSEKIDKETIKTIERF